ncbi:hypothetical protein [Ralstonia sp. UBA689]|uniref:hypothetical protein n=1 Tax=Ralstonia sp. UBA689 TaxID=1947373 RepID=UPI0025E9CD3A|nr:hypothetical protein [Ralstonia sp. UBA689]
MQQPADVACNLACAAMRDASRAAEFFIEAQIEFARLRLKMAEAALEDVHEMQHELAKARDWTSLAAVQSLFTKMQSSHGPTAMKTWVDFMNNLQAAYLRQVTEWNDQMKHSSGQTSSAQLFAASADSLRAFFDSFNVAALPDSEAKKKAVPRPAVQAQGAHAA